MKDMEIWKDIPGYEGIYQASSFGNIKSLNRLDSNNQQRLSVLMKPVLKKATGYFQVKLCSGNGNKKIFLWHRVIATVFIENINNKPCVNHIDCDKSNNKLSNLEWCTYKENTEHSIKLGNITPRGHQNGNSKLKPEDIIFIRNDKSSSKELSKIYGVASMHINSIRRKHTWKHI
jgi:hypothetical protein